MVLLRAWRRLAAYDAVELNRTDDAASYIEKYGCVGRGRCGGEAVDNRIRTFRRLDLHRGRLAILLIGAPIVQNAGRQEELFLTVLWGF